MKTQITPHLSVEFDAAEQETARWIAEACAEALPLIEAEWGLGPPEDCRFYLMTSPVAFFFRSAPWGWRILLGLSFPLWYPRVRRTWPYSAAWTQSYGRRAAIGVKPPHLWEQSDKRVGLLIYEKEDDTRLKVRQLACHELTHACAAPPLPFGRAKRRGARSAARLRLPAWLNEGIAVLTTERLLQKPVIRRDTLALVRDFQPKGPPASYRELSRLDSRAIAYHAVRGYWLARSLEETQPGFWKGCLARCLDAGQIEAELSRAIDLPPERLWAEVDSRLASSL
jgi:hypothetical protein